MSERFHFEFFVNANMLLPAQLKLIGSVAKESGLAIKTIRYYEELGLLKSSGRTDGGYRLFDSNVVVRLSFIKQAQSLGLSLSEIKEFLDIHDQGELPCENVKLKLRDKVLEIERQIEQLQLLKLELERLLLERETISAPGKEKICPIIERA